MGQEPAPEVWKCDYSNLKNITDRAALLVVGIAAEKTLLDGVTTQLRAALGNLQRFLDFVGPIPPDQFEVVRKDAKQDVGKYRSNAADPKAMDAFFDAVWDELVAHEKGAQ